MGRYLGAILTGGRSRRMGQDKADTRLWGVSMLDLVAAALRTSTSRTVLLGPDRSGWECWPDSFHAEGPLAGIATALTRSTSPHVVIVAVDQPFLRPETVAALSELATEIPVVPVDDEGARQVTCAIYPVAVADAAAEEARAGGSIQTLLDRVSFVPVTPAEWREWGEDGRSWHSLDTMSDVAAAERWYRGVPG